MGRLAELAAQHGATLSPEKVRSSALSKLSTPRLGCRELCYPSVHCGTVTTTGIPAYHELDVQHIVSPAHISAVHVLQNRAANS